MWTKWTIVCLKLQPIKEMHTKYWQFLHFYSFRLQNFVIIAHHLPLSLAIFKHRVYFFFIRQLQTCWILSVWTAWGFTTINTGVWFFFYLPILLKVVISAYSMYIHLWCWCLPPPTQSAHDWRKTKKHGFSTPNAQAGILRQLVTKQLWPTNRKDVYK